MFMGLIALNDDEILGRIKQVMEEKKLTDENIYQLMGIYEQKWRKWKERGIPAEWHYSFAKALGLNLEWLVIGDGNKYKDILEIKEPSRNYSVMSFSDNEIAALKIINTLDVFKKIQWLNDGLRLSGISKSFYHEMDNKVD